MVLSRTTRRILVTGGSGQLATALVRAGGERVHRVGRPEFDFDRPETIASSFKAAQPWLVINAAAYTAVDAAESNQATAASANRDGPEELARLCVGAGIPLIHISTDYVYSGDKSSAYVEIDPVAPRSVYGTTKLAGEAAVLASGVKGIILRTAWVYDEKGRNFVRTMLTLGQTRDSVNVVADQQGCPTSAADLATAVLTIAERLAEGGWKGRYAGVFHAAGSGETTWYGLATAVFEEARRHGARTPTVVRPITTAEYPTPACRPVNSRLDCSKLDVVFGIRLPHWRGSLTRTIDNIFA